MATYKNGGLTWDQIEGLFNSAIKRKNDDYKIIGAFHGVEIGDGEKSVPKSELPQGTTAKTFVFGDPDSYKNMDQNEKQKLTETMMGNHKQWSSGGSGVKPKGV